MSIYIYIARERDRERDVYVYIYIYISMYRERDIYIYIYMLVQNRYSGIVCLARSRILLSSISTDGGVASLSEGRRMHLETLIELQFLNSSFSSSSS